MNKLSFDVFKTQVDKHYCGRLVPYENAENFGIKTLMKKLNDENVDLDSIKNIGI